MDSSHIPESLPGQPLCHPLSASMAATTPSGNNSCYIGIDVGTGSARVSIVRHDGKLLASSTVDIATYRDERDHRIFEQSTTNIWNGIVRAVRNALEQSGAPAANVKGIGIDATCSLAVTDMDGNPVVVSKGGELGQIGDRSVILWADHRAEEEANLINGSGSIVLDFVGGTMSVSVNCVRASYSSDRTSLIRFWT